MVKQIRIATRRSRLAMWQANQVKQWIEESTDADVVCELVTMSTTGDKLLDGPLHAQGGKGLFLKELETALKNHQADLAVHSMKDVPIQVDRDFRVHSVGQRGLVQDVFVSYQPLHELPSDAKIGTSSLRRRALLNHVYRKSNVVDVRGNVETRLNKLDDGLVDGLVLAAAGLDRLGLSNRVMLELPTGIFVPAVGQGTLAVEYLESNDSIRTILEPIIDETVEHSVAAERQVAASLNADCASAFGTYCSKVNGQYRLQAVVLSEHGDQSIYVQAERADAATAAADAAKQLLAQGANRLLKVL